MLYPCQSHVMSQSVTLRCILRPSGLTGKDSDFPQGEVHIGPDPLGVFVSNFRILAVLWAFVKGGPSRGQKRTRSAGTSTPNSCGGRRATGTTTAANDLQMQPLLVDRPIGKAA